MDFDRLFACYARLGLAPWSDLPSIKARHRELVKELHPDLHQNSSPRHRVKGEESLKEINPAYEYLRKALADKSPANLKRQWESSGQPVESEVEFDWAAWERASSEFRERERVEREWERQRRRQEQDERRRQRESKEKRRDKVTRIVAHAVQAPPEFQFVLAIMFRDGKLVRRSLNQMHRWLDAAANAGMVAAQMELAHCYHEGIGVEPSQRRRIFWLKAAAKSGSLAAIQCLEELGVPYESIAHQSKSIHKSRSQTAGTYNKARSAERGSPDEQFQLAMAFRDGVGVNRDHSAMMYWLRRAAKCGHLEAMAELAFCFEWGRGGTQSNLKAHYWYSQAGLRGHASSQEHLGFMYCRGIGVRKDPAKGFRWYEESAALGNKDAQHELSICYRDGIGTERNAEKADFWQRVAFGAQP